MGEARRRGTREERVAQAIERELRSRQERAGVLKAAREAEAERVRNLPPEQRKEVILVGGAGSSSGRRLLLAAAMAAAGPALALPISKSRR